MLDGDYVDRFLNQTIPDIFGFVTAPWYELLGAPLTYAWFLLITFGMLYLKGQDIVMPAVLGIIVGAAVLSSLPPESHLIGEILLAVSVGAVFYRAFKS